MVVSDLNNIGPIIALPSDVYRIAWLSCSNSQLKRFTPSCAPTLSMSVLARLFKSTDIIYKLTEKKGNDNETELDMNFAEVEQLLLMDAESVDVMS